MGWVSPNTRGTQTDGGEEDSKIHVLRNPTIAPHEASVSGGGFTGDKVLETNNDLMAVVKDGVGDGSGVNGEEYAVDQDNGGGEVSWGVSLVTHLVEHSVLVDDVQNLVTVTGVIPNMIVVDRDVSSFPGVGVPDHKDHRGGNEGAEENIEDSVEGVDQRVCKGSKLVPIPGGEGIEAKTANTASDCSQVDVIRSDPGHPVEVGHGLDDVVGEPEVDEHGTKAVHEPPYPRDRPAVSGFVLHVECTL